MPPSKSVIEKIEVEKRYLVESVLLEAMKKYGRIASQCPDGSSKKYTVCIVPGDFDLLSKDLARATRGNYQIDMNSQKQQAAPAGQKQKPQQKQQQKGKKGGK